MEQNARKIFINTILLAAVSLAMRGVGMIFQVYLAGKIGAASLGVHSLIMSVYTMFVTLGSGGIRFAAARLTASCLALEHSVRKTVRTALIYALSLGGASLTALMLSGNFIAERWIGLREATPALKLLALSLPFVSVSAVFGGYFTGVERVIRSVGVSIFEQTGRIIVTVMLLGRFDKPPLGTVCASLAAASLTGEAISGVLHWLLYLADVRRFPKNASSKSCRRDIFSTAMPIAVSAYMRTGLNSLGHILIPKGLRRFGADFAGAFETYGFIHAMTFPVALFPSALLSALAELIVPRLTSAQARGGRRAIDYMTGRVFKIGLMFSAGVAAVMFFFGPELGIAVYKAPQVGKFMRIFAPLIPVMYCDMVTDGCLKGLGLHMKAMYINLAEAALNVILLYTLIPKMGILGYGISIYVCETFNFAMSFKVLLSAVRIRFSVFEIPGIFLCAALSSFAVKAFAPPMIFGIIASAAVYGVMLRIFGIISAEDIRWFLGITFGKPEAYSDKKVKNIVDFR